MSISATVDGTTYSGVQTITTGGKTISLAESGGSGGTIASGSFQPSEDTNTQTIETGLSEIHGFAVYAAPFVAGTVRNFGMCIADITNDIYDYVVTNNVGSTLGGGGSIAYASQTLWTISGGTITYSDSGTKLLSSTLYRWVAW